ncbi:MAG: polyprenyl synthetase family protein, partial [Candidatus Ranarchaeia archaeon]
MNLALIRQYRDKVEQALHAFLKEKYDKYSKYSSIHDRFYTNLLNFIRRGGKRLRPILMVVGYNAVKPETQGDIYKASCSVELLHTSTLIHDDLVDRDETRRGGPTFHIAYRNQSLPEMSYDRAIAVSSAMAILGGNIAWNLGLEAILESGFASIETNEAVKIYMKSFMRLINGVMLEESMSASYDPNEQDYLLMIAMKTSTLISNALKMGAVLGKGSKSQIKHLDEYGLLVGQAFQIRDDVLGTFGKRRDTGKSA